MFGGGRSRDRRQDPETEIDMVPVMNMFLVLIPFLLMSASFLHLKAINTSVPVVSNDSGEAKPQDVVKVMIVLEIGDKGLRLSAMSAQVDGPTLDALACDLDCLQAEVYPYEQLAVRLTEIKARYPASDTVLVVPGPEVLYDTIIQTMDAARFCAGEPLFPNVVLSGKVG